MQSFPTLEDADVKGKRVLVRVDFNVPMHDGKVADVSRIERNAPTITEIADKGGRVVLLSHFGRPKGRDPKESLKPVAAAVAAIIGRPIGFADDCVGEVAERAVAAMKPGDILCLENTRFHPGEENNDTDFAKRLARLGDIFVDDAFSVAHRAHASVEAIAHLLPAYAGRAMQEELEALEHGFARAGAPGHGHRRRRQDLDQARSARQSDDAGRHADHRRRHGQHVPARARQVGRQVAVSSRTWWRPPRDILAKAKAGGRRIVLPVDVVVAPKLASGVATRVVAVDDVGATDMILDIGPRSVEQAISVLARSKTLVWNGPFGAFEHEPFDAGTVAVAEAAAELTADGRLVSIAGGGDTMAALNLAGVTGRFTYVSTAGGAFLEWLEGKTLPGVEVLKAARASATLEA